MLFGVVGQRFDQISPQIVCQYLNKIILTKINTMYLFPVGFRCVGQALCKFVLMYNRLGLLGVKNKKKNKLLTYSV